MALLFSLETCIFPTQVVKVNFVCTKKILNLWAEANIIASIARHCVRCAIFLLRIKGIPFPCRLIMGFRFLKRTQNQFKMLLEMCVFPVSIVSTERKTNLLVVLYNCKIHLWLWKVWSLVVSSQSSFYVTITRKDDRIRQNKFFLC